MKKKTKKKKKSRAEIEEELQYKQIFPEQEPDSKPQQEKEFKPTIKSRQKMSDHIEEYFVREEGSKEAIQSRELFQATAEDIDLKTHLTDEEISYINTLIFNDQMLIKRGLNPLYKEFLYNFMRLKVSKDRLSRIEFVNLNRKEDTGEVLEKASNIKNLTDVRK